MKSITDEDDESTKETLYLLSNSVNAKWIQESIKQAEKGEFIEVDLDD
ncbi:hypothetical protein [Rickettsia bellii]|uniref:F5/8 type C domain-containing protein n=2 Tax=Rickettsia bellii TaxID=33990 RepID=A0A0F3QJM4_RICBE|nr:hypothetical protein [Rickettsia bellii]ABV78577.1 hypothetical protein A1I_00885 [Rickettsia bellii OSU 85-389]KJV90424.1 hypothetical protein RBEAN4_1427 [Rickettsia bellii str. RML An4]KJV92800.1 hypothetical protein RBEMOGI_1437 [Rickettsia bellii str. RML Mogi]